MLHRVGGGEVGGAQDAGAVDVAVTKGDIARGVVGGHHQGPREDVERIASRTKGGGIAQNEHSSVEQCPSGVAVGAEQGRRPRAHEGQTESPVGGIALIVGEDVVVAARGVEPEGGPALQSVGIPRGGGEPCKHGLDVGIAEIGHSGDHRGTRGHADPRRGPGIGGGPVEGVGGRKFQEAAVHQGGARVAVASREGCDPGPGSRLVEGGAPPEIGSDGGGRAVGDGDVGRAQDAGCSGHAGVVHEEGSNHRVVGSDVQDGQRGSRVIGDVNDVGRDHPAVGGDFIAGSHPGKR